MFNIGAGEMIFILVAALLILGPSRLPELARGIGKFLREFRRQTDEVRTVVTREFYQMDQEIQREPVRSPPPPATPAATPEQAALPPLGLPPPVDSGPYAHMMPSPVTPVGAPVEAAEPAPAPAAPAAEPMAAQASVAGMQAAAQAGAPEAAAQAGAPGAAATPGPSSEEEAVPRFAPIPGTVARNAPKQS